MRELRDQQITPKLEQFFNSYEQTFGEPANHNMVAFLLDSHLDEKKKDYILKFLGDYKETTLVKLNNAMQQEAKRRNDERTAAATPSLQFTGATIQLDSPKDSPKPKRKRKKRSDAGKKRNNSGTVQDS